MWIGKWKMVSVKKIGDIKGKLPNNEGKKMKNGK